jgi:hypothetical protein
MWVLNYDFLKVAILGGWVVWAVGQWTLLALVEQQEGGARVSSAWAERRRWLIECEAKSKKCRLRLPIKQPCSSVRTETDLYKWGLGLNNQLFFNSPVPWFFRRDDSCHHVSNPELGGEYHKIISSAYNHGSMDEEGMSMIERGEKMLVDVFITWSEDRG